MGYKEGVQEAIKSFTNTENLLACPGMTLRRRPEEDAMIHLLNLLAAIALLVWGTHIVRTDMLRVFGENLRGVLSKSFGNRASAAGRGSRCDQPGAERARPPA